LPVRLATYRNCNCPIWVQGSLKGEYIRRALDLRSWSAATDLVRDWVASGEIGVIKKADVPSIAEAVEKFFTDLKAQQLSGETIRKYENLLNKRFLPWCESKGYRYLKQLGVEEMRQFRAGWADSALYATKNLERLRAFFRFCMQDEWIARNPARSVKAPKVTDRPTLSFSKPEMERILAACDDYRGDQNRLRAFVLVMRHSGLRIGDTIALNERRLKGNKLLLYTAKTGTPVYVPLPPVVMKALKKLGTNDGGRYFSTGNAKPQTARANWSRYLDSRFALAKIDGGHSHRFSAAILAMASEFRKRGALIYFEPSGVGRPAEFTKALAVAHVVKYSADRMHGVPTALRSSKGQRLEIETQGAQGLRFRWLGDDVTKSWHTHSAFKVRTLRDAGDWCTAGFLYQLLEEGP
jgi:integrase